MPNLSLADRVLIVVTPCSLVSVAFRLPRVG